MKFWRRIGPVATALLLAVALLSALPRLALYYLEDLGPLLYGHLAQEWNAEIRVGMLRGEWTGLRPQVILEDVGVRFAGSPEEHRFRQIGMTLDLLRSLWSLQPVLGRVVVRGGRIILHGDLDRLVGRDGLTRQEISLPIQKFFARDLSVSLQNEKWDFALELAQVDLDVEQDLTGLSARLRVGEMSGQPMQVQADLRLGLREQKLTFGIGNLKPKSLLEGRLQGYGSWLPADVTVDIEGEMDLDVGVPRAEARVLVHRSAPDSWQDLETILAWDPGLEAFGLSLGRFSVDGQMVSGPGKFLDKDGMFHIYLTDIDTEKLLNFLRPMGHDPAPGWQMEGRVDTLHAQLGAQGEGAGEYAVRARFRDFSVSGREPELSVSGISGEVEANREGVWLQLTGESPRLLYPAVYAEEFIPRQARLQVEIWPREGGMDFLASDFHLDSQHLEAAGTVWSIGDKVGIDSQIVHLDLPWAMRLLPKGLVPPSDERWLQKAFQAGRMQQGKLQFLQDIPEEPGFFFNLEGRVEDVDLQYAPRLPWFRDIHGYLRLHGPELQLVVEEAKLLESGLEHVSVQIEDLRVRDLFASGQATGPAGDVEKILEGVGALGEHFGETVRIEGAAQTELELYLPLEDMSGKEPHVRASTNVREGSIVVPFNQTRMTELDGTLQVDGNRLTGNFTAAFEGHPATLTVATLPSSDIEASAEFHAGVQDLLPSEARSSVDWISGDSAWDVKLLLAGIRNPSARETIGISLQTDLKGIALDLPAPLGKSREGIQPLSVHGEVSPSGEGTLNVAYAGIQGHYELPTEAGQAPLVLKGSLPHIKVEQWQEWTNRQPTEGGMEIILSRLHTDILEWKGREFSDVVVFHDRKPGLSHWKAEAEFAQGEIWIPDQEQMPMQVRLKHLHIPQEESKLQPEPEVEKEFPPAISPAGIRPMSVHIDDFRYGSYRFQEVELEARPGSDGLEVQKLTARVPGAHLNLHGHWKEGEQGMWTRLEGTAHTDSIEGTLDFWSVSHNLREGEVDLDLELRWPGSPMDYELGRLRGGITLEGKDGRIKQLAPESARLLALLNLKMIFSRLSLEFDDVLRDGFTYQTVEGTFELYEGSLYTSGIRIIGSSAQILVIGRIGLVDEDYDLKVLATTETSTLLPVVAGAVAGPAGLGGTYVVNELLKFLGVDLNRTTTHTVTGSWADPAVGEWNPEEAGPVAPKN